MQLVLLPFWLLFSSLSSSTEANSKYSPRMVFPGRAEPLSLPGHHAPVQILLDRGSDTVVAAGRTHLNFYHSQNHEERKVPWQECRDDVCSYNITILQPMAERNQLFVCGTDGQLSLCCGLNIADQTCVPSDKLKAINKNIREYVIKEGEQSALVESEQSADLYITYSGSQENSGLYKFGEKTVRPLKCDKEQHYVGLAVSKRTDDPSQDKVYAFYKQKNSDTAIYSDMWLPFVTRVCMSDRGGPKNKLQFKWTSQLNAKLFCGNSDTRQHFSELVDTATVHAERWQDTKIYALFRNEWGMSAVCVYTIQDIDDVFTHSAFKDFSTDTNIKERRMCSAESDKLSSEILRMIEQTTEMDDWVQPVKNSGPLLHSDHNYTHIHVDKINKDFTVLFLSLNNGGIHKVMHNGSDTFVIAEYEPFKHRAHIHSMLFQPQSRKLYVNSRNELVQLDVANCDQYGNTCMDCLLSRDPYCEWKGNSCQQTQTTGTQQDESRRTTITCAPPSLPVHPSKDSDARNKQQDDETVITLPFESKFFLRCPVSSRHAQYKWLNPKGNTSCSSKDEQCLLLIDSMDAKQEGTHICMSEEMGSEKILARYRLQLENRGVGQRASPALWVCLVFVLTKSFILLANDMIRVLII